MSDLEEWVDEFLGLETDQKLAQILREQRKVVHIMTAIQDAVAILTQKDTALAAEVKTAVDLLNQLKAMAGSGGEPATVLADIQAAIASVDASTTTLAAADAADAVPVTPAA